MVYSTLNDEVMLSACKFGREISNTQIRYDKS